LRWDIKEILLWISSGYIVYILFLIAFIRGLLKKALVVPRVVATPKVATKSNYTLSIKINFHTI
jgi:cytochrome c oxidase subunit IV